MSFRSWLAGLTGSRRARDRADAAIHCRRGAELHAAGALGPARKSLEQAIELDPDSADARNNLGCVLLAQGEFDAAIEHLNRALESRPVFPEAAHNLAAAWLATGDVAQAEHFARLALEIDPASAEMHLHLGNVLRQAGRHDEALASCTEAARLQPGLAQAHNNLGSALRELGRTQDAIEAFARAVGLDPGLAEAHFNLGIALHQTNELDRAAAHYRAALELNPRAADAFLNLGMLLEQKGDPEGAIRQYRQAVSIQPEFAEAHFNLALQLLLIGDFASGWEEYEWRWRRRDLQGYAPHRDRPRWDGSRADGQTVLLFCEQGLGDSLQFFRYAPLVAERVGKVIVACPPRLQTLLSNTPGIDTFLAQGETLPHFDSCCPLLSLPRLFKTTPQSIPASVPYVHPDPGKTRQWRARLAADPAVLKVGLFWATDSASQITRLRSLELGMLAPLAAAGITYYSLQRGAAARQAAQPPDGMRIVDLSRDLRDFSDDAGLIANLDLVISVDTATAHLAGALGRPVWTLTHFPPDWRWLRDRDDSPWYPTMRLFRQERMNEWAPAIDRLGTALAQLVRSRTDGSGG